ncbi:MAG TPA: glycogen debranching N-terminal domain-containing protein [Rhizomicrobium sp.]|nr:glycogen debranching N-terminal domain-containing protein [Rhizomicrobium sp.]
MPLDTVSILDGNEFVVSNRQGDLDANPTQTHGLFLDDTRFLSRWVLTINGHRPILLSIDDTFYYRMQYFLALATGTVYIDSQLSVIRQRSVGGGFHEELQLINHGKDTLNLEVRIEAAADFADLFEVKDKLSKKGELYNHVIPGDRLTFGYRREQYRRETQVMSSEPAELSETGLLYRIKLEPKASWSTHLKVAALKDPDREAERPEPMNAASLQRLELSEDLSRWMAEAPKVVTSWHPLVEIYRRSLIDLAALRVRRPLLFAAMPVAAMPAAGLPWFMTIFGRDSLLTSFQALPFVPELAANTLQTLGLLQSRSDDPFRDAEPGKIPHEVRFGEMTAFEDAPHSPYYGTADATPLFLILLEEYERWTGDRELVISLENEARAAMNWIDKYGDRDGDGYIDYERRNPHGLENQCWKDSGDSIAFADGTLAMTPRATCELQGYAYDAKRRTARLAREVWKDSVWAAELDHQAADLKRRFNQDFWLPDRQFFALALDGNKKKVDSLTSNIGHLLWSGIADQEKADHCVNHLMSDALFSGWGVRTMGKDEGSYNPIGYHVGTVWPHDNAIIAWGLRRYGYQAEAARLSYAMLEAAELFDYRLPEAFGGYSRESTKFPVEYPTACSPQAWAAGTPLLLIRALLGLEAKDKQLIIDPALPKMIERLELLDVPGAWGRRDAFGRARLH